MIMIMIYMVMIFMMTMMMMMMMMMVTKRPGRGRPSKHVTEKVVAGEGALEQGRTLWVWKSFLFFFLLQKLIFFCKKTCANLCFCGPLINTKIITYRI